VCTGDHAQLLSYWSTLLSIDTVSLRHLPPSCIVVRKVRYAKVIFHFPPNPPILPGNG
jgi:hypothetical protein